MNKRKFEYNPELGDQAVSCNNEIVWYASDMNPEVVSKVVEMWNEGSTVVQIDKYMSNDLRCSDDERDHVVEQIELFMKLVENEPPVESSSGSVSAANGAVSSVTVPQTNMILNVADNVIEDAAGKVGVKKRGTKATPVSSSSKVSPEDYIKQLEEKIALMKLLAAIELPEIPTGITTGGRKLMVEMHKEFVEMRDRYIQIVKES